MPQDPQNNQKATSPSKLVQQGIDQSWGQQTKGTPDPAKALKDKFNGNPRKV